MHDPLRRLRGVKQAAGAERPALVGGGCETYTATGDKPRDSVQPFKGLKPASIVLDRRIF